jgi:hypothetical protein
MKTLYRVLAVAGLLAGSGVCAMADTMWTLNDVYFSDGNEATGWFTTDPTTTIIESFSLMVAGPDTGADFTATQMSSAYLPNTIGFASNGWAEYVDLYLVSPLTSAGGTIDISSGFDCPKCGVLLDNTNYHPTVTSGALPEPYGASFIGAGIIALAWLSRRKLKR